MPSTLGTQDVAAAATAGQHHTLPCQLGHKTPGIWARFMMDSSKTWDAFSCENLGFEQSWGFEKKNWVFFGLHG